MPERGEDDLYRWRLCLFFSVDLVGSTEFKSRLAGDGQTDEAKWAEPFKAFYREFPESFRKGFISRLSDILNTVDYEEKELPSPWKFMGDEILLIAEIRNSRYVPAYLSAFRETMREYSAVLSRFGLKCKGTVWSAGFPVINRIVHVTAGLRDYIGPSMDCGFRLTKFSSERRMVVSLEVAWMATKHIKRDDGMKSIWNRCDLRFYFSGMELLKGVLSNRPYPVIWLDTAPNHCRKIEHPEDMLAEPSDVTSKIPDFCDCFVPHNPRILIEPFIENDASKEFCAIPEEHKRRLDALKKAETVRADIAQREEELHQPFTTGNTNANELEELTKDIPSITYGASKELDTL